MGSKLNRTWRAQKETRGKKKRGETEAALFFPSSIFRPRPNFSPAPHHLNAWNRLLTTFIWKRCTLPAANRHETHQHFKCLCHIIFTNWKFVYPLIITFLQFEWKNQEIKIQWISYKGRSEMVRSSCLWKPESCNVAPIFHSFWLLLSFPG